MSVMNAIARLNERFAIMSVGNTVVVAEFRADSSIKELWPFPEFRRLLIKESVNVGTEEAPKIVPLADQWLKHPKGRQYDQLVYAMPGGTVTAGPTDFNAWFGFTIAPAPGDWSRNREHILQVICGGDTTYFAWLLNWCAALVQKPGQHAWTAIVLRGGQGIGKGHFVDVILGRLFHAQQYLHLLGANRLTCEFNEHLSGKVLVYADESTWGGDKQAAARLKGFITEPIVPIHRKFLKMVEEPSALHIVIASNNEWPIPVEWDDRRFFVLDVNETKKQDDGYFAELRAELEHGGRAALLSALLQHDVDWPALRHPPMTDAKRDIKSLSMSHEEKWFQNFLMNDADTWQNEPPRDDVYRNYTESFRSRNGTGAKSVDGLGKFLKKLFRKAEKSGDWPKNDGKVWRGPKRINSWKFPDLATCRTAFDRATGTQTDWPGVPAPSSAEVNSPTHQENQRPADDHDDQEWEQAW